MEKQALKFSDERLQAIRRLRMARRLWKKYPLFALQQMKQLYPAYTNEMFQSDLKPRSVKKVRMVKSSLKRFGRYYRMCEKINLFDQTGNIESAIEAQRLRRVLTKPYRVKVTVANHSLEFCYSPLINIKEIEKLVVQYATCKTCEDAETMHQEFLKATFIL